MTAEADRPINANVISFLNRDHVVLVTINQTEIAVTTTLGMRIIIPASPTTSAKFVDELTNHVESNFASIFSPAMPVIAEREWNHSMN